MRNLDVAQEFLGHRTTPRPGTGQLPTSRTPVTSEATSGDRSERPLYNRLPQDSHDQEASQRNNLLYRVDLLDGNARYDTRYTEDRTDAVTLAHDVIQAAASEWNAVHRLRGDDRVRPERSQFADVDTAVFDGQILVEWTVFPGSDTPPKSARVTAIDASNFDGYRDDESQVEQDGPGILVLII